MTMNWSGYAWQYDLLAEANPAYQALLQHCLATVRAWPLPAGAVIADFGAGTGNFSVALARSLPQCRILHLERDATMNVLARAKAERLALTNWTAVPLDLELPLSPIGPINGAVSIHALYTLARPSDVIHSLSERVAAGGYGYMADIGRPIRTMEWALYLLGQYWRAHGPWAALHLYARTGTARRANRQIRRLQQSGVYWTHTLNEFKNAFTDYQWEILYASDDHYRGITDVIVARKKDGESSITRQVG